MTLKIMQIVKAREEKYFSETKQKKDDATCDFTNHQDQIIII